MGKSHGMRDAAPKFWRSLGELEGSPEFRASAEHEFPHGAAREPETLPGGQAGLSRRDLLWLGAASAALAGPTPPTRVHFFDRSRRTLSRESRSSMPQP